MVDPAACGKCHKPQFDSLYTMNWDKTARKEKTQAAGPSPTPAFDKLMMPHGFTREHNLPRSHTFALLDQFVVDRAFGGSFGTKETWRYLAGSGDFKVWDVALDQYPDNTDQKVFKPGTAQSVFIVSHKGPSTWTLTSYKVTAPGDACKTNPVPIVSSSTTFALNRRVALTLRAL